MYTNNKMEISAPPIPASDSTGVQNAGSDNAQDTLKIETVAPETVKTDVGEAQPQSPGDSPVTTNSPLNSVGTPGTVNSIASHGSTKRRHVKLTVLIEYNLDKGIFVGSDVTPPPKADLPMMRKRTNIIEGFRRYYITYNISGLMEGKTDTLTWNGSHWSVVHDIYVNEEILLQLYEKPAEFVVWEVVRTEEESNVNAQLRVPVGVNSTITTKLSSSIPMLNGDGAPEDEAAQKPKKKTKDEVIVAAKASVQMSGSRDGLKLLAEREDAASKDLLTERPESTGKINGGAPLLSSRPTSGLKRATAPSSRPGSSRSVTQPRPISGSAARPHSGTAITQEENIPTSGSTRTPRPRSAIGTVYDKTQAALRAPSPKDTIHPHHFDHPEKHINRGLQDAGLVHNRTANRKLALEAEENADPPRSKTPILPHHHDHPLEELHIKLPYEGENEKKLGMFAARVSSPRTRPPRQSTVTTADNAPSSASSFVSNTSAVTHKKTRSAIKRSTASPMNIYTPSPFATVTKFPSVLSGASEKYSRVWFDASAISRRPLIYKNGYKSIFVHKVMFDLTGLFLGEVALSQRLEGADIAGLQMVNLTLTTNKPLLSKELEAKLNPLCIVIEEANNMPDNPHSFDYLRKNCLLVYARFQFWEDYHLHFTTTKQVHGRQILFQTRHLVLLGLQDPDKLRNHLTHHMLPIQIHDRDYKLPNLEAHPEQSAQFHLDPMTGRIKERVCPTNPHGVAYFSLAELCATHVQPNAHGIHKLKLKTPILPVSKDHATTGEGEWTIPMGLWLEQQSLLKISVEWRQLPAALLQSAGLEDETAFVLPSKRVPRPVVEMLPRPKISQLVIIPRVYEDTAFIRFLDGLVVSLCAKALNIQTETMTLKKQALEVLYTKLTPQQQEDINLDVVNGYHLSDGRHRVYFIEGIDHLSIEKIHAALQPHQEYVYFWRTPRTHSRRWEPLVAGITNCIITRTGISLGGVGSGRHGELSPPCVLGISQCHAWLRLADATLARADPILGAGMKASLIPDQVVMTSMCGECGEFVGLEECVAFERHSPATVTVGELEACSNVSEAAWSRARSSRPGTTSALHQTDFTASFLQSTNDVAGTDEDEYDWTPRKLMMQRGENTEIPIMPVSLALSGMDRKPSYVKSGAEFHHNDSKKIHEPNSSCIPSRALPDSDKLSNRTLSRHRFSTSSVPRRTKLPDLPPSATKILLPEEKWSLPSGVQSYARGARTTTLDVFNYSYQAKNSAAADLRALKAQIAKDKKHMYAYGPQLFQTLA